MPIRALKSSPGLPPQESHDVAETVQRMLAEIRQGGADVARRYAQKLDGWDGPIEVAPETIAAATDQRP